MYENAVLLRSFTAKALMYVLSSGHAVALPPLTAVADTIKLHISCHDLREGGKKSSTLNLLHQSLTLFTPSTCLAHPVMTRKD